MFAIKTDDGITLSGELRLVAGADIYIVDDRVDKESCFLGLQLYRVFLKLLISPKYSCIAKTEN